MPLLVVFFIVDISTEETMNMLEILHLAENEPPELLTDLGGWNSLLIDYHPPTVERLWRNWGLRYRIYLHCIHLYKEGEALFHPHPWPSAIKLISGRYESAIGYGKGNEPPQAARFIIHAPSAYEMCDPDGWHFVRPLDRLSYSFMITGQPWERPAPKSDKPLTELDPDSFTRIINVFQHYYPRRIFI